MMFKSKLPGSVLKWTLFVLLAACVPVVFIEPVFAFSRGDTTPEGTEIVTGYDPGVQEGQLPDTAGEVAMRWANRVGGDISYAATPDTESTDVTTLAYPHIVTGTTRYYDGDTVSLPPSWHDTIPITAWNLGNAPDTHEISLENGHDSFDYQLQVRSNGEIIETDGETVSTGEIKSIVENLDSPADTVGINLVIESPEEDNFDSHTITVRTETGHATEAYKYSDRGRDSYAIDIGVEEFEVDPLLFDQVIYTGRRKTGSLRAEQPEHDEEILSVNLWSVDKEGDTVDEFEIQLQESEEGWWYETDFGFTEGHSRMEKHPETGEEIPLIAVDAETTTLKAEINPEKTSPQVAGEDTATWSPEPAPDYVDNLDDVRTWPSPFNPTEGDPFVFQDLPADETMEIFLYNTRGQLIRRLTVGRGIEFYNHGNKARWWGKNDQGSMVASGVYVYVIQSQYGVQRGKVTLVK